MKRTTILLVLPRLAARAWRVSADRLNTIAYLPALGKVGFSVLIQRGARFDTPRDVTIGNNCRIGVGVRALSERLGATLVIGDGVEVNRQVHLDYTGDLSIGSNALISEGVIIYTHDHGHDPRSEPLFMSKTIGAEAWIGARAIILPGCRYVGDRAIVGAGAVVSRDVPDGVIVVGSPARPTGRSSSDERRAIFS